MNKPLRQLGAVEISRLEILHGELLAICLRLEEAAADIEMSACTLDRDLAEAIPRILNEAHNLEEQALFPDFDRNAGSCFAAIVIERLKAEHRCDRLAAEELSLMLRALADDRCNLARESIARILNSFQETLRRHIYAESVLLETLVAAKTEAREIFS